MLTASVAQGFSHADVPQMGASFLAVHDGDDAAARAAADWLARRAWDRRQLFVGDALEPCAALIAAAAGPGPVVLMDVGDNVGGGGPGDSTVLLGEAQRLGIRSLLVVLCDPEAVAACVAAGPGAPVTIAVGGKTDRRHGDPVFVSGGVRVLADGRFEDTTPTHGGDRYFDAGTTAVVETPDEHTVVLTSRRIAPTSLEQLYSLGVRPERKQVVVAKGIAAPRAAYGRIAAQVLLVDTPGVTSPNGSALVYLHRRRPLFPFERDASY
jgi:microcystin degradation protein MlrC